MSTVTATRAAAVERQATGGSGALSCNIVPANTSALYYLQASDVESLQQLGTRVRACFEAGALATGCAHEVTQLSPAVHTDLVAAPGLAAACDRLIGAQRERLISSSRRPVTPTTAAGGAV